MKRLLAFSLLALAALLVACGTDDEPSDSAQSTPQVTQQAAAPTTAATTTTVATSGYTPQKLASSVTLTGAGATFPNPFYTKAFDEYNKRVDPNVRVNYQSIGSSGGIKNFTEKTVDFGASDAFMTSSRSRLSAVQRTLSRSPPCSARSC